MKKHIVYLTVFLLLFSTANAQEDEKKEEPEPQGVDLLKAPASPAAQLLNIAPNAIEKPTDLSSFWLSATNASDGFSKFPTSYALDISPSSIFTSKAITLSDLNSKKTGDIMWQSFVISTGIKQQEDTATSISFYKAAIGVKFSIFRPGWTKETKTKYNKLVKMQSQLTDAVTADLDDIVENDPRYLKLVEKQDKESDKLKQLKESGASQEKQDLQQAKVDEIDDKIDKLQKALMVEKRVERMATMSEVYKELKENAKDFSIERSGPFLDFAGGFSVRFPTNELNYSLGDYSGAWLTGGYDGGNNKLSILGVLRYLYQPETIFADPSGAIPNKNISTFDMGSRVLYATKDDKFEFSFESVYRSVLSSSIVKPSWRLNFSAEYDLGFNQKLSFTFGRDFDGVVSKGGNLITALNFIAGFGNKKKIGDKSLN